MKKIAIALGLASLILAGTATAAEDTSKSKVDGFYTGLGGGVTFDVAALGEGMYFEDSDKNRYDTNSASDSDAGFLLYGGYQFNKIIAVEAAYTNYGKFSDEVTRTNVPNTKVDVSSKPWSGSVYANAGYTFDNIGLRPFAVAGLGYAQLNDSQTYKDLNLNTDGLAFHGGLGVEYAPAVLKGFGFRASYTADMMFKFDYKGYDGDYIEGKSTMLMRYEGMLYVAAQYKF